jgi:hypothetical protein
MSVGGFDIGGAIADFGGDLLDSAIDVGSDLLSSGLEVLDAAGDWGGDFFETATGFASDAWGSVTDFAGNADFFNANSFGSILNSGITTVTEFGSNLTSGFSLPGISVPGLVNTAVASIAGPAAGFSGSGFSIPGLVNTAVASIAGPILGPATGALRGVPGIGNSTGYGFGVPGFGGAINTGSLLASVTGGVGTGFNLGIPGFSGSGRTPGFGNTVGYGTPGILPTTGINYNNLLNSALGFVTGSGTAVAQPINRGAAPVTDFSQALSIDITGVGVNTGDTISLDPTRIGGRTNDFAEIFNPETGLYDVYDLGTNETVRTGLNQQQAILAAQDLSIGVDAIVADATAGAVGYESVFDPLTGKYNVVDVNNGQVIASGLDEQEAILFAQDQSVIDGGSTPEDETAGPILLNQGGLTNDENGVNQGLLSQARQQQAIRQQRQNRGVSGDWRVRLQLAPNSTYLYNDPQCGPILWPLRITDGVIFPYTPQIDTAYKANYEAYDLTHSNYRGYFYKNSYSDVVNIRATFTAQDTTEANYLLSVIHFFRSATKMFYGQDQERGSPPPLVYLSGLGEFQFNEHSCVISQFNYTLPSDVDYIRAQSQGTNGTNFLIKRDRSTVAGNPLASAFIRLANSSLFKGAEAKRFPEGTLGTDNPTYVPTKMEINLTLLPIQSRAQVSKQFSVKNFANGNLLKGGFW